MCVKAPRVSVGSIRDVRLNGLGLPLGMIGLMVGTGIVTHQISRLLVTLAVCALAIGVTVAVLLRADRREQRAISGQATAVRVWVEDSPADSYWGVTGQLADSFQGDPRAAIEEALDTLADRVQTGVRTGQRTALTAVPDSPADRSADSGQAVRVRLADR